MKNFHRHSADATMTRPMLEAGFVDPWVYISSAGQKSRDLLRHACQRDAYANNPGGKLGSHVQKDPVYPPNEVDRAVFIVCTTR